MKQVMHELEVQVPEGWIPVSQLEGRMLMQENGPRYRINYPQILEVVDAGDVVKVSLDHVSEGALRNGISYHASYTGIYVHCSISNDRRSILVYRHGVLP